MDLIQIPEKNIKIYLPRDLEECDTRQYIEMSSLIYAFQSGKIDYEHFRIDALYKLLNMKAVQPSKYDPFKASKIYQLSELVDSFFEDTEDGQKIIKQYYINNPIPSFRVNFRRYYGPDNEFDDVTFGEYVDALEAFIDFNQTQENRHLYRLAAILYRKKNFWTKKKISYNPEKVLSQSKVLKHQPVGVIYGVYLYFASFQKWLSTAKLYIAGNEIDLSILFVPEAAENKSNLPGLGMKGVLFALAESHVFGDYLSTQKTPLFDVLARMYDTAKRNADHEVQLNSNKTKK